MGYYELSQKRLKYRQVTELYKNTGSVDVYIDYVSVTNLDSKPSFYSISTVLENVPDGFDDLSQYKVFMEDLFESQAIHYPVRSILKPGQSIRGVGYNQDDKENGLTNMAVIGG